MKNPIDDIFGIEREEEIEEKPPVVLQKIEQTDDETDQDFELARQNIIDTIEDSKEAIAEMINVAKLSQHPRAYEVLGTMLKMQIESNKDLLELRKARNELMKKVEDRPNTINNNLIMSSADVLKLISDSQKK
jgi:hypothetical protein